MLAAHGAALEVIPKETPITRGQIRERLKKMTGRFRLTLVNLRYVDPVASKTSNVLPVEIGNDAGMLTRLTIECCVGFVPRPDQLRPIWKLHCTHWAKRIANIATAHDASFVRARKLDLHKVAAILWRQFS